MVSFLSVMFFLSGAAGLIYESLWSRYLGLFVGHTAYAQILVLMIYLGGMSVGAMVIGRISDRLTRPLVLYCAIEVALAAAGCLFHPLFVRVTDLAYQTVFPALTGDPTALLGARWGMAAFMILPQSILLGATFPLVSAFVLRQRSRTPGHALSLMYFANSLGAAFGVLFAGLYLIGRIGLPATLLVAALLNWIAGLGALLIDRIAGQNPASAAPAAEPDATIAAASAELPRNFFQFLLIVSFGTAVASFIYEITWIRMLSLVLGSSAYAFDLMLSAFILGLALGALWLRQRADSLNNPLCTLAWVQWLMGAAVLATLPIYVHSFEWLASLLRALQRNPEGYTGFLLARYGLCMAIMLPSTFCAGVTLPLITRILVAAERRERAIGVVYAVNTVGSIVGVALAGLLLLPLIGLKPLLIVGASLDMLLGVAILAKTATKHGASNRATIRLAVATCLVVVTASYGVSLDRLTLVSGVFRQGRLLTAEHHDLLYYKDGRTASVGVTRNKALGDLSLLTNGKPDASLSSSWRVSTSNTRRALSGDDAAQVMLPLVTLAHAPWSRRAAVVGQGSGISSHMLLGSPMIEQLLTIEIEPAMIEGSKSFAPYNRRCFDDPRSTFVIDDARAFLASRTNAFDLIMAEPSNPWVSGVSSLFTRQFYAGVRRALATNGIFGQWLQAYELNDDLLLRIIAAIHTEFRSYEIFRVAAGDLLIVAGNGDQLPEPDWSVFTLPEIQNDLHAFRPFTKPSLDALRLISRPVLAPMLDNSSAVSSDYDAVLDRFGERARFFQSTATWIEWLSQSRLDLLAPLMRRRSWVVETASPLAGDPRTEGLARSHELRTALARGDLSGDPNNDRALRQAAHRLWRWNRALESGQPPPSWRIWCDELVQVELDVHAGTAGYADQHFYEGVHTYLDSLPHPQEVDHLVGYLQGWASWDFVTAARAVDGLLPAALLDASWIPIDVFLDGAVMAKLLAGDGPGARNVWQGLNRRVKRPPRDPRNRLLEAYLDDPKIVVALHTAALTRGEPPPWP